MTASAGAPSIVHAGVAAVLAGLTLVLWFVHLRRRFRAESVSDQPAPARGRGALRVTAYLVAGAAAGLGIVYVVFAVRPALADGELDDAGLTSQMVAMVILFTALARAGGLRQQPVELPAPVMFVVALLLGAAGARFFY